MKLFLLRHEERALDDISFYSPLLPHGLDCANKLKYTLENYQINLIFCSPFKRTIQTIKPYCDMKNIKLNIEHSLYEKLDNIDDIMVKQKHDLLSSSEEYYLKNLDYVSYLSLNDLKLDDDAFERSINFLQSITSLYKDVNVNILFVTHSAIIKNMINSKNYKTLPTGGLILYDYETQSYTPINYNEKKVRFN